MDDMSVGLGFNILEIIYSDFFSMPVLHDL